MRVRSILESGVRLRVVLFLALALVVANADAVALARTAAYFTATSSAPVGNMTAVRLDVSTTPSVSGIFNVASNMLPADFQLKTIDLVNNGTAGIPQQDFTYAMTTSSTGAGNTCSLLDSSDPPTCASPAARRTPRQRRVPRCMGRPRHRARRRRTAERTGRESDQRRVSAQSGR